MNNGDIEERTKWSEFLRVIQAIKNVIFITEKFKDQVNRANFVLYYMLLNTLYNFEWSKIFRQRTSNMSDFNSGAL